METKKKTSSGKHYYACGKRKTSIARVKLYKGTGKITINDKDAKEYITIKELIHVIKSPLKLTKKENDFDIIAQVEGGGPCSQADAIRHGIAKALSGYDTEMRLPLKKAGHITRDSRIKERKKPGLRRARRSPQWSKR